MSIGEQLREAREAQGLTLEAVERAIRIRAKQLAALEADDYTVFASALQARGFLRNYAAHLGLDANVLLTEAAAKAKPKPLLPQFARPAAKPASESEVEDTQPQAPTPRPSLANPTRAWMSRIFTRDLAVGLMVTLLVGVLLVWGGWQFAQGAFSPPTPTATLTASPTLSSGQVAGTFTPTPGAAEPTSALPTPLPNYVGVNVIIRAEQRVWLRVAVDGAETFTGQLAPGATREFVGNSVVEVWTGNGRGTRVIFNGQDQGLLGDLGQVVIRLWTVDGAVTPTPSPTVAP
ncbi:MAG: DUF4115 domain-containing protein [Anaerolineales bacterium]|nr:DUF4115 domain-containing protein [Anaerolineales bacterium]